MASSLPVSPWSCWGGGVLESDRAADATSGTPSQDLGINLHFIGDSKHYSADNPECTDPHCSHDLKARSREDTRKYLDAGNFDRVFKKYQKKQGRNVFGDELVVTGAEVCCFLVVKAMSVGAKVSRKQKEWLKKMYKHADLCREGIQQMTTALADYQSGAPYELIEPDRTEHNIYYAFEEARAGALGGPVRLDYPCDRWFENGPERDPLRVKTLKERRLKGEPTWFPGSPVLRECGICEVKAYDTEDTNNPTLKACAICKKILYCQKDCQRAHWKTHKKHCASFATEGPPPDTSTLQRSPLLIPGHDPLGDGPGVKVNPDGSKSTLATGPTAVAKMLQALNPPR